MQQVNSTTKTDGGGICATKWSATQPDLRKGIVQAKKTPTNLNLKFEFCVNLLRIYLHPQSMYYT